MRDHNSLKKVMGELFTALFDDFRCLTGFDFDLDLSRVLSLPTYSDILSFLGKHEAVLIDYFRTGVMTPRGVKASTNEYDLQRPVFLSALWDELVSPDEQRSIRAASLLRQAFALVKKVEIAVDPTPSFDKFVSRQKRGPVLSSDWQVWVDGAADVLFEALPDLDIGDLRPYVSTGASLSKTPILDRCEAVEDSWVSKFGPFCQIPRSGCGPFNRAAAVPKDWSKVRIVFVEDAKRMLIQQALRRQLEVLVETGPLHKRIRFDDQAFQQSSLRYEGRSSIDLSDASDNLWSVVIWRFFRRHPLWRSALFSSRSRRCLLPNGDTQHLRCYSTMGNATTFTVMSIFLACLTAFCEAISARYCKTHFRVSTIFGDDVVCDDAIAGTVLNAMTRVGLVPNTRKTFVGSVFRESCGLDLFKGADVTPISIKRWNPVSTDGRVAWVAYSNAAHRRCLWHLAAYLAVNTESVPVNTSSGDDCLYSFCNGVDPRHSRWLTREQRYVWRFRARTTKVIRRDNELQLSYALVNGRLVDTVART